MLGSAILASLAIVSGVSAHGGVLSYSLGGTYYKGFVPYNTPVGQSTIQRSWATYDPLLSATDSNLACNTGQSGSTQLSGTVAAGAKVTAYWNAWPHSLGPLFVYMASCGGSCSSANAASLRWFKIDQQGLVSGTINSGVWGMANLIKNNNSWTSTIPASLAAGEYMIRHELLALHSANAPQFYPECAQLKVTGGGGMVPSSSSVVTFPGGYSASDPSINLNPYSNENQAKTTYAMPGPAVWSG